MPGRAALVARLRAADAGTPAAGWSLPDGGTPADGSPAYGDGPDRAGAATEIKVLALVAVEELLP